MADNSFLRWISPWIAVCSIRRSSTESSFMRLRTFMTSSSLFAKTRWLGEKSCGTTLGGLVLLLASAGFSGGFPLHGEEDRTAGPGIPSARPPDISGGGQRNDEPDAGPDRNPHALRGAWRPNRCMGVAARGQISLPFGGSRRLARPPLFPTRVGIGRPGNPANSNRIVQSFCSSNPGGCPSSRRHPARHKDHRASRCFAGRNRGWRRPVLKLPARQKRHSWNWSDNQLLAVVVVRVLGL